MRILAALLLFAAGLPVSVSVSVADTIAITGAEVRTAGRAGTLQGATVVIEDGRIVAVGKNVEVPGDAETYDAGGKIVTPGLFTPAGHIGLVEVGLSAGPVDAVQRGRRFTASFDVADAFNPHSTLVPVNRIEGVTRALTMPRAEEAEEDGAPSSVLSGLAAVVNLSGAADSVDRRRAALVVNLGEYGIPYAGDSRASALLELRYALDEAADFRDHRIAWDRGGHREFDLSIPDLEVLTDVLAGEIPLLVHADRASDIHSLTGIADEYDVRVIISGGAEAWVHADELAARDIAVVLAPEANLPSNFDRLGARLNNAALLVAAGVSVAFADGQGTTHNARNITQSAGNATVQGLSAADALKAITIWPAEIYGVADEVGSIEVGKDADIVVWPGDPFELAVYPEAVFIEGKRVPMESRQTLLRDRYLDVTSTTPPAYRN